MPPPPERESSFWRGALVLGLLLGAALRVGAFAQDSPLWHDEAMLALAALEPPLSQLRPPLAYVQAAPIPFAWAIRACAALFGPGSLSLHLPALLGSLAELGLVAWLWRRLFPLPLAVFGVVATALCPLLVQFSAELKQYTWDAFGSAAMVALTWWALQAFPRRAPALLLGGLLALSATLLGPLLVVSAGAAVLLSPEARRARGWVAAGVLTWGLGAGAALRFYAGSAGNSRLQWYWEAAFLPPEKLGERLPDLLRLVPDTLGFWPVGPGVVVFWGLVGLGALSLGRRHGLSLLAVTAGPLVGGFLAAVLRLYPLAPRTTLYWLPLWLLLMTAGLAALAAALPWRRTGPALVVAVALLRWVLNLGTWPLDNPTGTAREPVAATLAALRPGEPVYVDWFAIPAWVHYTTDWDSPDHARLRQAAHWTGTVFSAFPGHRIDQALTDEEGLWTDGVRVDVLGGASGIYRNWLCGKNIPPADSDFGTREADRLLALNTPSFVLFLGETIPGDAPALYAGLHARGVRCEEIAPGVARCTRPTPRAEIAPPPTADPIDIQEQ